MLKKIQSWDDEKEDQYVRKEKINRKKERYQEFEKGKKNSHRHQKVNKYASV